MLTTPWLSCVGPEQVDDLELGLAEERVDPACSSTMIERRSTPTEAADIPP